MSPIFARRLGACINNTTKHHHVRLFSASRKWQQTAAEHISDHKERLNLLQAEDFRLLQTVKASANGYQAALGKARDRVASMPATLESILPSEGTVHSIDAHRASFAELLASIDRLKDAKLPHLRAHVEDLEYEDFPVPGGSETEIEFRERIRNMTDAERQDMLDSLTMEINAFQNRSRESMRGIMAEQQENSIGSGDQPLTLGEMRENPFAKNGARDGFADSPRKKSEVKPKFGMGAAEQSDNVILNAAKAEASLKKKKMEDNANFGLGLVEDITSWKPLASSESKPKVTEWKPHSPAVAPDLPKVTGWKPHPPAMAPDFTANASSTPKSQPQAAASDNKSTDDKHVPKPKAPSSSLEFLQSQLEASWKKR